VTVASKATKTSRVTVQRKQQKVKVSFFWLGKKVCFWTHCFSFPFHTTNLLCNIGQASQPYRNVLSLSKKGRAQCWEEQVSNVSKDDSSKSREMALIRVRTLKVYRGRKNTVFMLVSSVFRDKYITAWINNCPSFAFYAGKLSTTTSKDKKMPIFWYYHNLLHFLLLGTPSKDVRKSSISLDSSSSLKRWVGFTAPMALQ